MKRLLLTCLLVLALALISHADWVSIHFGRVIVQGYYVPNNDPFKVAGQAYVNAEERLSIAVEDYCTNFPDRCASLGIVVKAK